MRQLMGLALLALGACAAPTSPFTKLVTLMPEIPSPLLNCDADPAVPAATSQAAVANYVVTLWQAGHDCRAHLATVRAVIQQHPD